MTKVELRDIVIILPGIIGSALQKDGSDIWAISGQAFGKVLGTLGSSLDTLEADHGS